MKPVFFMKKKKEKGAHFFACRHMCLPLASWPSQTGWFSAEAFYSVAIWAARVSSVKIKYRTRVSVSFKCDDMHASALRGAIKIQGILLPVGWGFQPGTRVNVVRRWGKRLSGSP